MAGGQTSRRLLSSPGRKEGVTTPRAQVLGEGEAAPRTS